MPQARKPSTARRPRAFKEPAALKRLNRSLDTAEGALAELGKQAGRDVGAGVRDLHKDLRGFVSGARSHGKKLAKALQRDFEDAQKQLTASRTPARAATRKSAASKSAAKKPTAKRASAKKPATAKPTASKPAAKKPAAQRTTARRTTGRRTTAKRS